MRTWNLAISRKFSDDKQRVLFCIKGVETISSAIAVAQEWGAPPVVEMISSEVREDGIHLSWDNRSKAWECPVCGSDCAGECHHRGLDRVKVTLGSGEGEERCESTLADFLADNDFEPDFANHVVRNLRAKGYYRDGGGAAPEWCLELVR